MAGVLRLRRAPSGRSLPSVRRRLAMLAMLGVTLTMSVAGAALVCLGQLGTTNQMLAEVNRAQRHHQDADMMHDALRADVVRAHQAVSGASGPDPTSVAAEARDHAADFRENLRDLDALQLPPRLEQAAGGLRPTQRAYILVAEQLVRAAVLGRSTPPGLAERYDEAFRSLTETQAEVTEQLATTSERIERTATAQKTEAVRVIAISSMAALAGWMALALWHHRSMGSLHGALVREAAHRAAADVLQRSLLPSRMPTVPGVQLAGRSIPGERGHRVGGDWYDVISLPTGELGLVVGDVLGHDLAAATTMGQLRNALRAYALDDPSPAGVLTRVNRAADLLDVVELATCLYAIFDPETLTVRWSSAGHLAPLVSSRIGDARLVSVDPGPPLGALPDPEYADHVLHLRPGDALGLYTDGLVERRGESIDVGLRHLAAIRGPHPTAEAMCDRVISTLVGDSAHCDDVTLLVLQTSAEAVTGAA
jgi:serine phosphatase RsbU (regulator of sigma subunit)